jgi:hypothetical protein
VQTPQGKLAGPQALPGPPPNKRPPRRTAPTRASPASSIRCRTRPARPRTIRRRLALAAGLAAALKLKTMNPDGDAFVHGGGRLKRRLNQVRHAVARGRARGRSVPHGI